MDAYALTCIQKKKVTKQNKLKKKPLKVVYISNPMNFKTSASEFMALVQELTGQHAEWPPDCTRLSYLNVGEHVGGGNQMVSGAHEKHDHYHGSPHTPDEVNGLEELGQEKQQPSRSSSELFDPLDEFFQPQMMDNFLGSLPATVFYESAPL